MINDNFDVKGSEIKNFPMFNLAMSRLKHIFLYIVSFSKHFHPLPFTCSYFYTCSLLSFFFLTRKKRLQVIYNKNKIIISEIDN